MDGFFDFMELRTEEKLLSDVKLLGLDLETTGLDVSANEIIEIGIASYDMTTGTISDRYTSYIRSEQPVKDHITRITGIEDSMLNGAPKIDEISDEIREVISNSMLIIHNAEFDVPFLRKFLSEDLLQELNIAVFDTLKFSRKLIRSSRYSLEFLIESLGLKHENHHRASDDARMCLQLFDHLLGLRQDFRSMTISDILKTAR